MGVRVVPQKHKIIEEFYEIYQLFQTMLWKNI
jgi:hypothetical protein